MKGKTIMITERENFLRTARFKNPQWIPMEIAINGAMWAVYKKDLEDLILRHPIIFNGYVKSSINYNDMNFDANNVNRNEVVDAWGCTWIYPLAYMDGVVIKHPLANIDDLDNYVSPKPPVPEKLTEEEWRAEIIKVNQAKADGQIVAAGTDHGFMLLRHTYLRGFEEAMIDYATKEPKLHAIIDMITDYYMKIVQYNVRRNVDLMYFAEDLGTQQGTLISPSDFREWIKPAYKKLMAPCKENGILVGLHSDGKTLEILEDQVAAGVDMVNPQDLCNGIDELEKRIKGKACIQLDVDRQSIIPYGTKKDIDDLIKEEVMKLGSKNGGLTFIAGIYPPTPMENLEALCCAFEKYRTYWWD
jgi:uroporphyrinogen-III decarboxylase